MYNFSMSILKKILSAALTHTLILQLTLSPVVASIHEEPIVQNARPDRSKPHRYVDRNGRTFFYDEYFLGAHNNDCFFNALGAQRIEAIEKVEFILGERRQKTLALLDLAIEDQAHEPSFHNLRLLSQEEKRAAYLAAYKTTSRMIECAQNIGDTSHVRHNTITLFDVLAYAYQRTISVFRPLDVAEKDLEIFHRVTYGKRSQKPTLSLLLKGSHFNVLIPRKWDGSHREQAQMAEERYLAELRSRVFQESLAPDLAPFDSPLRPTQSSTPEAVMDEEQEAPTQEAQAAASHQSPSAHLDEEPLRAAPRVFARDDVLGFLLKKNRTVAHLSPEDSLQASWDALSASSWATPYEKFAGKCTLILEHDFLPGEAPQAHILTQLIEEAPRALQKKAHMHQVGIYMGRLHKRMGNQAQAWRYFACSLEEKKYSQIAKLYMAEMILMSGYRPLGIPDPQAYAQELLEQLAHTPSTRRRITSARDGGSVSYDLHNPYLNHRSSHQKAARLVEALDTPPARQRGPVTASRESAHRDVAQVRSHAPRNQRQSGSPREPRPQETERSPTPASVPTNHGAQKRHFGLLGISGQDASTASPPAEKRPRLDGRVSSQSPVTPDEQEPGIPGITQSPNNAGAAFTPSPTLSLHGSSETEDEDEAQELKDTFSNDSTSDGFIQVRAILLQAMSQSKYHQQARCHALCFEGLEKLDKINMLDVTANTRDKLLMLKGHLFLQLGNSLHAGTYRGQDYRSSDWFLEAIVVAKKTGRSNIYYRALVGLGNRNFAGRIDGKVYTPEDCFEEVISKAPRAHDDLRVRAMLGLANMGGGADNLQRQRLFLNARKLARDLNDPNNEMRAYLGLGNAHFHGLIDGKLYTNKDCFLAALDIARDIKDPIWKMQAYLGLGNAQYNGTHKGKAFTTEGSFLKALKIARLYDQRDIQMRAFLGLGNCRFQGTIEGKFYSEEECYHEAIALAHKIDDKQGEMRAHMGLGNMKSRTRSQRYASYRKAYVLAREINDRRGKIQSMIGLGRSCFINEHRTIREYYHDAINLCTREDEDLRNLAMDGLKFLDQARSNRK
ncbi:MAG: hypothetical protein C0514_06415 [Candidatus Puniceispirillum sp.]|nr:hypothetical protein [Candidatus Puniceispirillum sp.]